MLVLAPVVMYSDRYESAVLAMSSMTLMVKIRKALRSQGGYRVLPFVIIMLFPHRDGS